jgi:hypothetical protein
MRIRSVVSCFLIAIAWWASAAAKKASGDYDRLVERVKGGDKTVDFRELRLAYADSPAYDSGPDTDPQKKAMWAALNSKDFVTVIKNADTVLASDYVDMDAHFAEYVAHRELNETDLATFHKFVFDGLLKSITDSGDGKTPETAYQVIEVHEEYVLLRFMGAGLPDQSLLHKNGHSYDEMKYEDPTSKQEVTIYFNVDIPAKHGL